MAYVFGANNNTKPTTFGFCMWNFIAVLVAAGWTIKASGDGLAAYSAAGNCFSATGATGANGLNNSGAWIRLGMPDGSHEICIVRGTTSSAYWGIYASVLGFSGGAPSATQPPTATDSYRVGVTAITQPSKTATASIFGGTEGSNIYNCAASNAAPYTAYASAFPAGNGADTHSMAIEALTSLATGVLGTDPDPYMFAAASGAYSFTLPQGFYGFANGTWGVHSFDTLPNVSVSNPNPYSGYDDARAWGVTAAQAPNVYFRGYTTMMLFDVANALRAQHEAIDYNGVAKSRILVGSSPAIALPWDGSVPVLT